MFVALWLAKYVACGNYRKLAKTTENLPKTTKKCRTVEKYYLDQYLSLIHI